MGDDVSPALQSLYQGDVKGAALLLPEQCDIFEAAAFGRVERLRALLEHDPSSVGSRAADDFTPLHLAVFFARPDAAALLLQVGADVEAEATNSFVSRVRPLHSAVAGRDLTCCRLLVGAGADVNALQGDGFSPLMVAAQVGDEELTRLLIDAGADPRSSLADGVTAAELARAGGHGAVAALLETS